MTSSIKTTYDQLAAKKDCLLESAKNKKRKIRQLKREITQYEKARVVFTEVSKISQQETKKRIENLVTLAIRSVFENSEISFKINFETKNNRIYAYPIMQENGLEFDPKEDLGGGIIDIISIALKIILWHLEDPRKRNVLILDEPLRFTGKLVTKAGAMIKYLAKNLNLQIIMVSHDDALIDICDQVHKIHKANRQSKISLIKTPARKIRRRKK
jgi:DNA repair exonuclease SbcCD ATPase subunit